MPQYYGLHVKKHNLRPVHHADNKSFRAWPGNPNEVIRYGKVLLKWEVNTVLKQNIRKNVYINNRNSNRALEVIKLFSLDEGETWQEDTYTKSYGWATQPTSGVGLILENAILEAKKEDQKRRNRERARERNARLKKIAEKEGITLTELKRRKREERRRQNPHKVSKKTIEQTNRKMKIGPYLKDLKDEIDYVMEHFDSDKIEVKYVDRTIKRISEAADFIRGWRK